MVILSEFNCVNELKMKSDYDKDALAIIRLIQQMHDYERRRILLQNEFDYEDFEGILRPLKLVFIKEFDPKKELPVDLESRGIDHILFANHGEYDRILSKAKITKSDYDHPENWIDLEEMIQWADLYVNLSSIMFLTCDGAQIAKYARDLYGGRFKTWGSENNTPSNNPNYFTMERDSILPLLDLISTGELI